MQNISFIDLLKSVTVNCKDNGSAFVVRDRLDVIEHLLEGTEYRLVAREPLALLFAKRKLHKEESVVVVSSHVDCVYEECFCYDEDDCLRGTFDNSFGNASILWHMLSGTLPDEVVVAFTGDEERDSQGAVQTILSLGRMKCNIKFAIVLDVTNTGYPDGSHFALENDLGIDIVTAHRIIDAAISSGVDYTFKHEAEPDESWDYNNYGIPSLSLCMPVQGNLHDNVGVILRKKSINVFNEFLIKIISVL